MGGDAYRSISANVQRLALAKNGASGSVRLVAVSKLKPADDIRELYALGQRHFGENYVQELVSKAQELPDDIQWHFIGSIQSNKIKSLCGIKSLWATETIETVKHADLFNKEWSNLQSNRLNVFVQVNTSGESSKSGVAPDAAVGLCQHIMNACPSLRLLGLMTIGAIARSQDASHPNEDFEILRQVRSQVQQALGLAEGTLELSMGMSTDYERAIEQGSTQVRIGSSIFGARPPRNIAH